ncbi:hypothetical protein GCM10016234_00800 [Tianweitania populi]|uniref:Uncharacterized protein n=1 Tax=Tianweitania populi TaxID=1607949 RepID=A0A8J3DLU7_9HYPH|nr:hypothetical protein GCM10016234_00800 [Tianweitania populi]
MAFSDIYLSLRRNQLKRLGPLGLNLKNGIDLDRETAWQGARSKGGTRMPSLLSEHFNQKIGSTIDNRWMILEGGDGIDETTQLQDRRNTIEIAIQGRSGSCKQIERANSGSLVGFSNIHILTDHPEISVHTIDARNLS